MPSSRKPLKRFLIICGVLLVLAVLGEVILQILGFGHPALVRLNDITQYELLPNQHVRRMWPLSDSAVAHVDTNQFGMRSMPISPVKPSGTLRIYFLGDSITYGTTQIDQSQIFTDLIRRELPSIVHQPVEVMDGAISGWAITNELAYLKEHGTVQADRVILVLNDGDPAQPVAPKPYNYGIPSVEFNPKSGYEELWFRVAEPMLQKTFKKHHIPLLQGATYQDPGLVVDDDAAVIQQNLRNLDEMRAYLQQNNTPFSILFIPFPGSYKDPVADRKAEVAKEVIAEWTAKNNVPFLYIGPYISRSNPASVLLRDHSHFNMQGNREVATAIENHWATLTTTPAQTSASAANPQAKPL